MTRPRPGFRLVGVGVADDDERLSDSVGMAGPASAIRRRFGKFPSVGEMQLH
jgi:hypothetical protein